MTTMRIVMLTAATFVAVACGKVKPAHEQDPVGLVLPDYPMGVEVPFELAEGQTVGNFEGNLILWNGAPAANLIQTISEASVKGRQVRAATLDFVATAVLPAISRVEDAKVSLATTNSRIAHAEALGFSNPELLQETRPIADQWFETRLAELAAAGRVTEADKVHAQEHFGLYCEAKLWEFGTSVLLQQTFDVRPTPLEMCEPYYATKAYFQDQDLCGPGAGKDYFNCIWKDGVFKSPLYTEGLQEAACIGTDPFATRGEALQAWLADGILRAVLADNDGVDSTTTYAVKMTSHILGGADNFSATGVAKKAEYATFKRCRSAFRRDASMKAAPYTLRSIAEVEPIDVPLTPFKLLPPSGNADADVANYDQLAKYLKVFGKRFDTDRNELPSSYSDYLFNHPSSGRTLQVNGKTFECDIVGKAGSERCPDAGDPAFARLAELKRNFVKVDEWREQAELYQAVSDAETVAAQTKIDHDKKLVEVKQATIEGVTAVNVREATVYFHSFGLRIMKNGPDMTIVLAFKDAAKSFYGCVREDGGACDVWGTRPEGALDLVGLSFDASKGRLLLKAPLDQPAQVGFGPEARVEGVNEISQSFNDLPLETYQGRVLEFEMYANRLGSQLSLFTGDAKILDGTKTLVGGSISGDDFAEAHARLLGSEN